MKKILAALALSLLVTNTAHAAATLQAMRLTGRNSPGQHYQDLEVAVLPALSASPFPHESYAQTLDTRDEDLSAQNSRFANISTTPGPTNAGAGSYNLQAIKFHFTYQFSNVPGESIFTITSPDPTPAATPPGVRIMDFLQNPTTGKLEIYGFASETTPVLAGNHVYRPGDKVIFRVDFDMGATEGTGAITLSVYNATTKGLLEKITGTNIDFGDFTQAYTGGNSANFGVYRAYYGRVISRGGDVVGTWGEGYATTGDFLPMDSFVSWQFPNKLLSSTNGWTTNGTSDFVDAISRFDSFADDLGKYIAHALHGGTGPSTRIDFGFPANPTFATGNPYSIYGVIVCLDGWSTNPDSSHPAQENLIFNYGGADYKLAGTIVTPRFVGGDGGNPHTRCMPFYNQVGGVYLGPDGLPWSAAKLQNSTLGVQIADDSGEVHVTDLTMGVMYHRQNLPTNKNFGFMQQVDF